MSPKKKSFITGAGILALALFIAKIIGAGYRVPLVAILGAEGMGIYQLIFPIYSFLLSTSSGALPIAISLLVSEKIAKGQQQEAQTVLQSAMSVLMMSGVFISLALVLLAKPIGYLQGNTSTFYGYLAIAPAVFFVSGIAVLRGWFQGNGNMFPSAVSQITEAIIKLIIGLAAAYLLAPYGIMWGVFGAMAGVTASEAVTFVVMYIIYRKKEPPIKLSFNVKEVRRSYKDIMKISIPITIGGVIVPFTQIIDSMLVINILSKSASVASATASYGLFSGYVATLVNLPIVLGLSLGIAVVPHLSRGKAEHDILAIKQKSNTAVKLALVIGVPFAFLYATMAPSVLQLLYPSLQGELLREAGILLQIGAGSVIFLSITQIYTSILQGIGETYKPVKNMALGATLKIILNIILLPLIGIYGVAIASLACFALTAVLNGISEAQLLGKSPALYKNGGAILLCGAIMGVGLWLIKFVAVGRLMVILLAVASGIIYIALLLLLKVFNEKELVSIPFGKHFVRRTPKE